MKHLLLCLFTLLITDVLWAQTDISDYSLRHFTSENGLSQNSVKAIAEDNYGFMWLATETGLLRFDGSNFKQFDKSNTGIRTSRMLDIRRSPDGKELLAITDAEELLIIAGGKAQKTTRKYDETSLPQVTKLLQLRPVKWQYRLKEQDSLFFRLDEHLGALIAFQHGIIWHRENSRLGYTDLPFIKNSEVIFFAGQAVYRAAARLAGDTLQRITPQGITRIALKGDFLKLPARNTLKNCFVENCAASGQIFLYADQHLYQVLLLPDGSLDTRLLLSEFDLSQHQVYSIYYDSLYQRIFIGSHTDGLYILDRKNFRTAVYHGKHVYPMIDVVYDQVALNDSTILTGNGTLFCTNPRVSPGYKNLPGYDNEHAHQVRPVFRSHNGNIWLCGPGKLYLLDSLAARQKKEWNCVSPITLAESRDGRIWMGTWEHGVYLLDPAKPQSQPELFLPGKDRIICMEHEDDTVLWVSTIRHLLRLNIHTRKADTITGLTDKMVRGLYIPRPGEVWICTYEDGLYLWLQGRLTHFPMQSYPYLKTLHKILEDEQGFFWMSTNHGMYKARKADLLAYAHGTDRQEELYLFYYSKESGFLTNEFNGGSQYVGNRLGNGFFSLSSMNGVVFFRPSAIRTELPEGKVIIDKLEVDGKEIVFVDGLITLNRNFRTLRITPVSAYMGNPANLKYEFRLNNDTDWRSTYNGAVILSSLPTGKNEIFIRKRTGFENSDHAVCRLMFYVPPAWWQTQWFCFSVFAGLVLLVWLIIRLRVRYWQKRNKLLERAIESRTQDLRGIIHDLERSENKLGEQLQFQRMLNESITHDITTPLKYLTIFTGNVLTRADEDKTIRTDIEHIHQGANRIYGVVQDLGLYMRSKLSKNVSITSFNIYNLTAQKAALFTIAAASRNDVIENRVNPDLLIHQNESLINIILHNLIDNAVKNTENGKVIISTVAENGNVMLSVTDTGKGMTPAQLNAYNDYFREQQEGNHRPAGGFGFLIIKEIAHLLKLEITVASGIEKGTCFQLLIPQHQLK